MMYSRERSVGVRGWSGSCRARQGRDAVLEGVGGGVGAAARVDLGVDVRQVALHGGDTQEQLIRDLLVRAPTRDEAKDFGLARGEAVGWCVRMSDSRLFIA